MKVDRVRLGDVLELQRTEIIIDPAESYTQVGVRGFGRGFIDYGLLPASSLSKLRYFKLAPDRLVISNIKGWEGAVACTREDETDRVISNRFLQYRANGDVDLGFVRHWLLSDSGIRALGAASPGSADRNRTLSIQNFEAIQIPLPSLPDQRRIAAHLDSVASRSASSIGTRYGAAERLAQRAIGVALDHIPARRRLGDFAEINPRPRRVAAEDDVAFVPMSAVSDVTGTITEAQTRQRNELTSGYKQACDGDIIFARITPCMQNGKCAIYRSADDRVMYGSTEFHVVRCPSDLTEWVQAILRTDWCIEQARASFTGTAGQQRVPARFLENLRIPIPDDVPAALRDVRGLIEVAQSADSLRRTADTQRAALLPAARNEVFSQLR